MAQGFIKKSKATTSAGSGTNAKRCVSSANPPIPQYPVYSLQSTFFISLAHLSTVKHYYYECIC